MTTADLTFLYDWISIRQSHIGWLLGVFMQLTSRTRTHTSPTFYGWLIRTVVWWLAYLIRIWRPVLNPGEGSQLSAHSAGLAEVGKPGGNKLLYPEYHTCRISRKVLPTGTCLYIAWWWRFPRAVVTVISRHVVVSRPCVPASTTMLCSICHSLQQSVCCIGYGYNL